MRSAVVLVLLALIGQAATAQQPPAAVSTTLNVSGVITSANDAPLPRVRVGVPGAPAPIDLPASRNVPPGVLTDALGQFTIQVPAAQPRIVVSKAGYIAQTLDLPAGPAGATNVRVRLLRGGVVSGIVSDRTGVRVMLAVVTATAAGGPAPAPVMSASTNDLGEFRLAGLADGPYVIAVRPPAQALIGSIAERQAVANAGTVQGPTVTVSAGTEVSNIALTVEMPSNLTSGVGAKLAAPDPEAAGSMSGRVATSDGLPVARAIVTVSRPLTVARVAETDERGRYTVDRLGAGEYSVEVQKFGFASRRYGQTGTDSVGRRVVVREGQAVGSIDVTLSRGGAIAGTIFDEYGEPAEGVEISTLQVQSLAGRRRALRVPSMGTNRTDDRGQYRVFGLQPGTYVVQAQVRDAVAGAGGYAPLYYPGAFNIDQGTSTKVSYDTAASGIDFTLVSGNTHRVAGTVFDVTGKPGRASLTLTISERSGGTQVEPVIASANPDGTFVFTNVPPGDYVVQANAAASEVDQSGRPVMGARQFAMTFVTVDATDPPPLQLRLSRGATLSGQIRYEGLAEAPANAVSLMAFPADFDRGPMIGIGSTGLTLRPDNTFEYRGVFGPTLIRVEPRQRDWYLKSIAFRGRDIADVPFDFGVDGSFGDIEIVVSALGAAVSGRVTDDRAAPVSDYVVLLFSTFRDRWFPGSRWIRTGLPSQDGSYRIAGLPPGDYWVAAIDRVESTVGGNLAPPESDLLEPLSARATRITLGEGQTQDVALRLIRR